MFHRIVFNLSSPIIRNEPLEGRPHIVVPMVMLGEGVHPGSMGPIYYPAAKLADTPEIWNHKPIVVNHPEIDGRPCSACDPVILNTRKVGVILNAHYDAKSKKLRAEAWMEESRLRNVDDRILNALNNKQKVEVSTGLFYDVDETPGEFDNEAYIGVINNLKADHLALLPDGPGAYPISKGGGLLANAMSFDNIRHALCEALRSTFGVAGEEWFGFIEDTYANFVIYYHSGKLWKVGYSSGDSGVKIKGDPIEVKRVVEYRTMDGTFVGNANPKKEQTMDRKPLVDKVIGNGQWVEGDRPFLMGLTDDQFTKLTKSVITANTGVVDEGVKKGAPEDTAPVVTPTPVVNAAKPITDPREYIAQAPPAIQALLSNSLVSFGQEVSRLSSIILENKATGFYTKEMLEAKALLPNGLQELQALAAMASSTSQKSQQAQQQTPSLLNFAGLAPPSNPLIENKETPLEPVVIDWKEMASPDAA